MLQKVSVVLDEQEQTELQVLVADGMKRPLCAS